MKARMIPVDGRYVRALVSEDGAADFRVLVYYQDLYEGVPFGIPTANNMERSLALHGARPLLTRVGDNPEAARDLGLRRSSVIVSVDNLPELFESVGALMRCDGPTMAKVRGTLARIAGGLTCNPIVRFHSPTFEEARHLKFKLEDEASEAPARTPAPAQGIVAAVPPAHRVPEIVVPWEDRDALAAVYKEAVATRAIANRYYAMSKSLEDQLPLAARERVKEAAKSYFVNADPAEARRGA